MQTFNANRYRGALEVASYFALLILSWLGWESFLGTGWKVASKDTGEEDWPQVASQRTVFQISNETAPLVTGSAGSLFPTQCAQKHTTWAQGVFMADGEQAGVQGNTFVTC